MFNTQKFIDTQFKDNVKEIKVPRLKAFFDEGEEPIIKVKALTGNELAKVNEAIRLNKDVSELIEGLVANNSADKIESIKKVMGLSDDVPGDIVRRIAVLVSGCVEPEMTQEMAVKLADAVPEALFQISTEILALTGEGKLGE